MDTLEVNMEGLCENSNCKKKLREYRELTGKLYDEVDKVEEDLKERDEFLPTSFNS